MSKIQKESKSQLAGYLTAGPLGCCDLCQRYKKKANHNTIFLALSREMDVVTYVKDTKRKQITTLLDHYIVFVKML